MKSFERIFPWAMLAIAILYLGSAAARTSRNKGEFDLIGFGNLPVQTGGRVKPLDTLARNSLYAISHKAEFKDADGKKQPAIRWFADMLFNEEAAAHHKVFRIVNDDVLHSLGLKAKDDLRYAYSELPRERLADIFKWAGDATAKMKQAKAGADVEVTVADKQAIALATKVNVFLKINAMNEFPKGSGELTPAEVREWLQLIVHRAQAGVQGSPRLIPNDVKTDEDWSTIGETTFPAVGQQMKKDSGVLDALTAGKIPAADFVDLTYAESSDGGWLALLWKMRDAYRKGNAATFNDLVANYQTAVAEANGAVASRMSIESFMNAFQPFIQCIALTVLAFLLLAGSWLGWHKPLVKAALVIALVTLTVHTFGLFTRMYLEDRPFVFVTNLYSSAVFIGWIVVIVGLFLEWVFRNSVGLTVACVVSFLSLIVAHNLDVAGAGEDNMQIMQAVLDTNFWLATHVTTVTIGYAATFIAGFLGVAYILLGIFTPVLDKDLSRTLGRMIYGVICGATMLSFIGTVLGGIWADQSWGRFWGWDPKENGALIIVMWNALILHARWGGLVRQRGIAVLAVFGNIVTTWSWFGTNMLGVGLHAYGEMDRAFFWMMIFMSSQIAIMAVGALWPTKSWLSYEAMTKSPPKRRDGKRLSKLDKPSTA